MEQTKAALLVIDMQNGFLEAQSPLWIAQAKATVPCCARVIRQARQHRLPVIFITRAYRADGSDVELARKARWEAGGKPLSPDAQGPLSAAMPAEFEVQATDYRIVKPRYSGFFHTELDLILRRLGVRRIFLTGTTTPNCIRTTCYDGLSLDYDVVIVEDCCSSQNDAIQKANMLDMANAGAQEISSAEFEKFLEQ